MSVIGYARFINSDDFEQQQAQHDLVILGIDALYKDVGRSHTGLKAALKSLRQGDCLVVTRLSQFHLNLRDLLKLVAELRGKGIHLASLNDGVDTRSHIGWPFYQNCLALLAMERQLLNEKAGIAAIGIGPPRGRNGGRPRKLSPDKVEEIRQEYYRRAGRTRIRDIAKQFGISKQTLYTRVINTPDPPIN